MVSGGELALERGEVAEPDAVVTSDAGTMLAVAHGREELESADLVIEGDREAVERFFGLFPLPEPVA